ncbi:MAG: hypothetical protein WAO58_05965 [Fimbriimonadaceae bacterium]
MLSLGLLVLANQAIDVPVPEPLLGMSIDPSFAAMFDANRETGFRTEINPAVITISFERPREARGFRLIVGSKVDYLIEAGESTADLDRNSGTQRELAKGSTSEMGEVVMRLDDPSAASIYRLTVRNPKGKAPVDIAEWQFVRFAEPTSLRIASLPARRIDKPSERIPTGGIARMRAWAQADGAEVDVTDRVRWSATEFTEWPDEKFAWQAARFLEGERKGGFTATLSDLRTTADMIIESFPRANRRPDVDVLYIERTPRIPFNAKDKGNGPGWPKTGETIVWKAHVRAHGRGLTEAQFSWWVDGKEVRRGKLTLASDFDAELDMPLKWKPEGQKVEFFIRAPEWDSNPGNNKRSIMTNSLAVGFWIEEKLWHHWHDTQFKVNAQNEGFEDWAQSLIEQANPTWRLDKVVIVPSGALPLGGGSPDSDPDPRDDTLDIVRGFGLDPDGQIPQRWMLGTSDQALIEELRRIKPRR